MTKPEKFTPEYFLARGFGWGDINEDYDLPYECGWIWDDGHNIEFFVFTHDDGLIATLYFGSAGDRFPYDIYDTEWMDELLYTIWRIKPDGTRGKVKE